MHRFEQRRHILPRTTRTAGKIRRRSLITRLTRKTLERALIQGLIKKPQQRALKRALKRARKNPPRRRGRLEGDRERLLHHMQLTIRRHGAP